MCVCVLMYISDASDCISALYTDRPDIFRTGYKAFPQQLPAGARARPPQTLSSQACKFSGIVAGTALSRRARCVVEQAVRK